MKLRFIGQRNHLGPGTHFANFVDAFKKFFFFDALIEEIDAFNVDELARAARSSVESDVNVWFCIDSRIRNVLEAGGIDPEVIDGVPEGVATNAFHPHLRDALDRRGQPFRFLMVGKYEERKGYPEVLDAFKLAFGDAEAVELVLKADYFLQFEQKKQALEQRIASLGLRNVRAQRISRPARRLAPQGGFHAGAHR